MLFWLQKGPWRPFSPFASAAVSQPFAATAERQVGLDPDVSIYHSINLSINLNIYLSISLSTYLPILSFAAPVERQVGPGLDDEVPAPVDPVAENHPPRRLRAARRRRVLHQPARAAGASVAPRRGATDRDWQAALLYSNATHSLRTPMKAMRAQAAQDTSRARRGLEARNFDASAASKLL